VISLRSGRRVWVRPVGTGDSECVQAFVRGLSARTRYYRYCSALRELPASLLDRTVQVDGIHSAAFLAMGEGSGRIPVGMGEYHAERDDGWCEIALVVADAWQREGLGTALLSALESRASVAGIDSVEGFVLRDNAAMLQFARNRGFAVGPSERSAVSRVAARAPGLVRRGLCPGFPHWRRRPHRPRAHAAMACSPGRVR